MAERKNRNILEVIRAVIFQGQIPLKYWVQRVLAATYLINGIPSRVLGDKSPYEKLHRLMPMVSHLRVLV